MISTLKIWPLQCWHSRYDRYCHVRREDEEELVVMVATVEILDLLILVAQISWVLPLVVVVVDKIEDRLLEPDPIPPLAGSLSPEPACPGPASMDLREPPIPPPAVFDRIGNRTGPGPGPGAVWPWPWTATAAWPLDNPVDNLSLMPLLLVLHDKTTRQRRTQKGLGLGLGICSMPSYNDVYNRVTVTNRVIMGNSVLYHLLSFFHGHRVVKVFPWSDVMNMYKNGFKHPQHTTPTYTMHSISNTQTRTTLHL